MIRCLAVVLVLVAPLAADAALDCRSVIAKASARHAQAAAKTLQKCHARVLAGRLPPSTDCRNEAGLAAASARLAVDVARACCGADGACATGDDSSLASIGWDIGACPDFESVGCDGAIDDAEDIAPCLACIGLGAVDQLMALTYGEFAAAPRGSTSARCQVTIGKEAVRFARTESKALQRCWDARLRGSQTGPCPDAATAAVLAAASAREREKTCASCGGADRACGSGDDPAPTIIGHLEHCPAVTVPGGVDCARPIATVDDLVTCLACVGSFKAACVDRVAVPTVASYPAECNPPSVACSAGVECETSLDCPHGYTCRDNGGATRYCVGATCTDDAECADGGICRQYCTTEGCGPRQCQCPGFGCTGPDELCLEDGGLACRKICTQDSDCVDPFGLVCVNPGFGFGVCIGSPPCQ
jgi:hypothetical protein